MWSYVPINLCKVAGSIHLFKIRRLTPEYCKIQENWIWDILEIDCKEVNMNLNGNEVNLPTSVILPFRDKCIARKLIRKQPLLLHVMLKQGRTCWKVIFSRTEQYLTLWTSFCQFPTWLIQTSFCQFPTWLIQK